MIKLLCKINLLLSSQKFIYKKLKLLIYLSRYLNYRVDTLSLHELLAMSAVSSKTNF